MKESAPSQEPKRIAFCTTCMGRLDHLKSMLPDSLEALQDYPNSQIVILDYNSKDFVADELDRAIYDEETGRPLYAGNTLETWLRTNYSHLIKPDNTGKIIYARADEPEHFQMSHAKNMAHRIAIEHSFGGSGAEVLCNLDADNSIGHDLPDWINKHFSDDMNSFARVGKIPGHDVAPHGFGGRIILSAENFLKLRGYGEHLNEWGAEDIDFSIRADTEGLKSIVIPLKIVGQAIPHSIFHSIFNMSDGDVEKSMAYYKAEGEDRVQLFASSFTDNPNLDGNVGVGTVTLNFQPEKYDIQPLAPSTRHEKDGVPSSDIDVQSAASDSKLSTGTFLDL